MPAALDAARDAVSSGARRSALVVAAASQVVAAEPLARLGAQRAEVLRIGSDDGAQLPVPAVPEELSPVLEVLPLQRLAWELATSRGYDPDRPAGLRKVTETR